jgi:hypothetical protein
MQEFEEVACLVGCAKNGRFSSFRSNSMRGASKLRLAGQNTGGPCAP